MDDTLLDILADVLAYLKMGHAIQPTSIIAEELHEFVIAGGLVSEEDIGAHIAEFEQDGMKWMNFEAGQ